jgi:hypothetical protein
MTIEKGNFVILALLHLSIAFDTVDHQMPLMWLVKYLKNSRQLPMSPLELMLFFPVHH